MIRLGVTAALVAALATGCATTAYRPVVDHGVSTGNYETDLAQCQQLATERMSGAQGAGAGAIAGALFGAVLGAAFGLDSSGIGAIAGVGAAQGAVSGGVSTYGKQTEIVSNCVSGRGWKVVAS